MFKNAVLVLIFGVTLTGCEKVQVKFDLECKNDVLNYHYERKVIFPFGYTEQSAKGIATYADNGEVIKCNKEQ